MKDFFTRISLKNIVKISKEPPQNYGAALYYIAKIFLFLLSTEYRVINNSNID